MGLIAGVFGCIFDIGQGFVKQGQQVRGSGDEGSICGVAYVNPYNFAYGMAFSVIDKVNPC
jgi:hypothetical protein